MNSGSRVGVTVVLALAYVLAKVIEYTTSGPRNEVIFTDGKAETRTVTPKGVDLEELRFIAGFGAFIALVWALKAFGALR